MKTAKEGYKTAQTTVACADLGKGDIMDTVTGYVYSIETGYVLAEVTGDVRAIEQYVATNYDLDMCGMTFSPAFGCNDGLIDNNDKDVIEL